MQLKQTKKKGLEFEYHVSIPAKSIDEKINEKLKEVASQIKLDGFRPGKVPLSVVKKKHGKDIIGEVMQSQMYEGLDKIIKDEDVRPAMTPKFDVEKEYEEGKGVEFKISFEAYPEIPEIDLSKVEVFKYEVQPGAKDVDDGIERVAKGNKEFKSIEGDRKAKEGDALLMDFVGRIEGEAFEGGTALDSRLELGSGQFIPGFEDQLIGVKKGEEKIVKVTFPENYQKAELAGKPAEFEVKVKDILEGSLPEVDDEFAKKIGYETLDNLKKEISDYLKGEFEQMTKIRLKKDLFDALDKAVSFEIPQGMVKTEFDSIWQQYKISPEVAKEGSKEEKDKQKEYEKLAERRVRLGVLLADIARKNNIDVTDEELRQAVFNEAKAYPGQEQMIIEYYQKNPSLLENLKGPIIEDKVVDYLMESMKIESKKSTAKEMQKYFEEDQD